MMILACTHFGNIDDEPVLLHFDGICDLGLETGVIWDVNKRRRMPWPPFNTHSAGTVSSVWRSMEKNALLLWRATGDAVIFYEIRLNLPEFCNQKSVGLKVYTLAITEVCCKILVTGHLRKIYWVICGRNAISETSNRAVSSRTSLRNGDLATLWSDRLLRLRRYRVRTVVAAKLGTSGFSFG